MFQEVSDLFYDLGLVLFSDRSDWLPEMEYAGFARGIWSAGDSALSLGYSLFKKRRENWKSIPLQVTDGKMRGVAGGLLIWSSLKRSQSLYSFFVIDAFVDVFTALQNYICLKFLTTAQDFERSESLSDKPWKKLDQEIEKAKKLLIGKGLILAGWLINRFIYPSMLVFIGLAAAYLHTLYQHAKPTLGKIAGVLFCCHWKRPLEDGEEEFDELPTPRHADKGESHEGTPRNTP